MHAGSFSVSVIHQTLAWTTGCLMCVCDHSYACVYTKGLDTQTVSQHNISDSEKVSQIFLVLLTGIEPRVFGFWVQRSSYQLRHPITPDSHHASQKWNTQGWRVGSVVRASDWRSKGWGFESRQEHKKDFQSCQPMIIPVTVSVAIKRSVSSIYILSVAVNNI